MRRKDKEMTDVGEILDVVGRCMICRLAMVDGDVPYVVPMNFAHVHENGVLELFFHGAMTGRKIDVLKANPNVCVEMDLDHGVIRADEPCDYGYAFESVVCAGKARFLEDVAEKTRALNVIMAKYSGGSDSFAFGDNALKATAVYAVRADWFTGKRKLIAR